MKRSAFLKALAALPLVGFVFGAPKAPEPVEAEGWEDLDVPASWDLAWDDPNIEWSLAEGRREVEVPSDGVFSVRCRHVAHDELEWSVLDASGEELYRGPVEPVIVSPGFDEPQT